MAVKDYNVDPDLNTTISGINIAEGCAPSGINNAIRQLMADVKEAGEAQSTKDAEQDAAISAAQSSADAKLPLTGGEMSGAVQWPYGRIFFQDYGPYILGLEGSSAGYTGAGIYLFNGYDNDHPGAVQLATRWPDGSYGPQAFLKRDGAFEWNGKNVVRSVNGVSADAAGNVIVAEGNGSTFWRFADGLQICRRTDLCAANETGTRITFPAGFSATPHVVCTAYGANRGTVVTTMSTTKSNFVMRASGSTDVYVYWIAIGNWK